MGLSDKHTEKRLPLQIQKSQRPSRQHSEGASLSGGPSGEATSGGKGSGAPASDEPASSGTEGSQLTRPSARHALPFGMGFQPLGSGASSILHQRSATLLFSEHQEGGYDIWSRVFPYAFKMPAEVLPSGWSSIAYHPPDVTISISHRVLTCEIKLLTRKKKPVD